MRFIFILTFALFSFDSLYSQSLIHILREARELEESAQEEAALDKFLEVLEISPNNHEALWNVSFLYSRIGNRMTSQSEQENYFNQAKDYAERAIRINPRNEQSNFVMSVALGRMALISSARDRVAASRDIKKYADNVLDVNPDHAGAHHVLGLWHYRVANLSWTERSAARVLFGGVPDDASNEDSIYHFKKAIELDPDFMLYYYDLANTYYKLGKKADARNVLNKMLELESKTADDPQILRDGRTLLQKL